LGGHLQRKQKVLEIVGERKCDKQSMKMVEKRQVIAVKIRTFSHR
jgi:hypothetical protein